MVQTGSASANWWSIAEFNVYGTTGATPAAPTGLAAAAGDGQAVLNWNTSLGASGYDVKRASVSGGPYTVIATNLPSLVYTNTGLADGTTYYFVVSATNSSGEGPNSSEVSAQPSARALAVSPLASGMLTLTWATNTPVALYYAPSLGSAVSWTLVTNTPAISNGQWSLTLPIGTNISGYYRLQR